MKIWDRGKIKIVPFMFIWCFPTFLAFFLLLYNFAEIGLNWSLGITGYVYPNDVRNSAEYHVLSEKIKKLEK